MLAMSRGPPRGRDIREMRDVREDEQESKGQRGGVNARGSGGSSVGSAGAPPTLVVEGCKDATVSKIISGHYKPHGSNHGRPIFKKESGQFVALIYYWDDRDGDRFKGWWFGPQTGGDQVWARADDDSAMPPPSGWKVPWDGKLDPSLRVMRQTRFDPERGGRDDLADERRSRPSEHGERSEIVRPRHRSGDRKEDNSRRQARSQERGEDDSRRRARSGERGEGAQSRRSGSWERDEPDAHSRKLSREREDAEAQRRQEADKRRRFEQEARAAREAKAAKEAKEVREAERRRRQDEGRRKEDAAVAFVRKVMQRLKSVTPESLADLCAELEDAQADKYEIMGVQADALALEVDEALQKASKRVEDIRRQRDEDKRHAEEERRKRQENAEQAAKLLQEARELVAGVESEVAKTRELNECHPNAAEASPEAMNEAASAIERNVGRAHEASAAAAKDLCSKLAEIGAMGQAQEAKQELAALSEKISAGERLLKTVSESAMVLRAKAARLVAALDKHAARQAEFERHDVDMDGKLSGEEVVAFAKSEYGFEVSEAELAKIMRVLEPVDRDNFQRMRGMVASFRWEARARQRRAEAEALQRAADDAGRTLTAAVAEATRLLAAAEAAAARGVDSPLVVGATAGEAASAAAAAEEAARLAASDLARAAEQVEALAVGPEEAEALREKARAEKERLQVRLTAAKRKVAAAEAAASTMRRRATRKEYAELGRLRNLVAMGIRERLHAEGQTKEQFFEEFAGGEAALTREAFAKLLESLDVSLSAVRPGLDEPSRAREERMLCNRLFAHAAGEEVGISEARFAECIRQFYHCVRSTVLNETTSIKSKTVRRLDLGDGFEVLEGPFVEEGTNLRRVRGRVVGDDALGWATVIGNQGTPLLEPTGAFFIVARGTPVTDGRSLEDSKTLRGLVKGEVVEVFEFGLKDEAVGVTRVRGRAVADGVVGWITSSGNQGTPYLEPC